MDGFFQDAIPANLQTTKNISFIFSSEQISISLKTSKINDENQKEFSTLLHSRFTFKSAYKLFIYSSIRL